MVVLTSDLGPRTAESAKHLCDLRAYFIDVAAN